VVIIVSKGWIDTSRHMLNLTGVVMSLVMSDEKNTQNLMVLS